MAKIEIRFSQSCMPQYQSSEAISIYDIEELSNDYKILFLKLSIEDMQKHLEILIEKRALERVKER